MDIDFGISIYKKEDVDFFLSFEAVKEVQVPANIFDISNIIYVSGLNKFRRIAIRSIFGRGVFFFGDEKLIEIFGNKVASTFIHRRKSLEDSGFLDFATTTMRYFSVLDSVDKIIVGSRDIERLLSYQSIVNLGHEFLLPFDNSEELFITNPRNWGF